LVQPGEPILGTRRIPFFQLESFLMGMTTNQTVLPVPRRRSQRIFMTVRVRIRGKQVDGKSIEEQTETVAVNAHGALVLLDAPVTVGQSLKLWHRSTQEEVYSGVVYVGTKQAGKTQVGIQFLKPSPHFWRVAFPPDDWSPKHPDARAIPSKQN
jgi:hypothetical protein